MAKKFSGVIIIACILLSGGCKHGRTEPVQAEDLQVELPPSGFFADSLGLVEGKVKDGETFTALLVRHGMGRDDAMNLAAICDTVFDVRKMRAGNTVEAYYCGDTLKYLVYCHDKLRRTVFRTADSLAVWNYSRPVVSSREFTDVTIRTSLWNDMADSGAPTALIVSLADIYAWSVDFFALQQGDRFRVLYSQKTCDGEVVAVDTVQYAEFIRDGSALPAVMFDQGDGGNIYWKPEGESLRKAFLKAPLQFTRISSGFSYHRKHPVSGKVRPHTAVDYAAPTGTPVMTIGDGTVLSAGWTTGGGKTVKIRHNSSYITSYMHLSGYAKGIKEGARVKQGQVIGYVGATGVATGPHLDFRVWKDGTPENPLKLDSPPDAPILPKNLPALDSAFVSYKHIIDSLTTNTKP